MRGWGGPDQLEDQEGEKHMRIQCVEIVNFRRLKSTYVDFDEETTIFVGGTTAAKHPP